ncbi:MAG: glycosyltransferase [Planctomycetota bacterium]|nr:glycosyltransferase [Planctomycetota bacterium]
MADGPISSARPPGPRPKGELLSDYWSDVLGSRAGDGPRPMRILHYIIGLRNEFGGPVRATIDLSNVLAARGHDVTVMTHDDKDAPAAWKQGLPGVPKVRLIPRPTLPGGFYAPEALAAIEPIIRAHDILHLHGVWERPNLQFSRQAADFDVPYVVSLRGMLDDWCMHQGRAKKRLYLAVSGRRMLEEAGWVHCTAVGELEQSKKWFPKGRGAVIPNLLDLGPFREMPGTDLAMEKLGLDPNGPPIILFLSRLHEKKGPGVLLRAAAILKAAGKNFRLLLAGAGDAPYVKALNDLTASLGLSDCVRFLGLVSGATKLSLYRAAHVMALPTSQENFGFVFYEALASGTPIVTTYGADTWPELRASGGALIVHQKPEDVAQACSALLDDPTKRDLMGRLGRQWMFDCFEPMVLIQKFEGLYQTASIR